MDKEKIIEEFKLKHKKLRSAKINLLFETYGVVGIFIYHFLLIVICIGTSIFGFWLLYHFPHAGQLFQAGGILTCGGGLIGGLFVFGSSIEDFPTYQQKWKKTKAIKRKLENELKC